MENKAINVVNEFLTAVQKGDMEKVASMVHPEIVWSQPGANAVSGIKRSAGEVFEMVGKMFQCSDNTLTLTDIKVLAENGESVACLVHWKATQTSGRSLDIDNIDVYSIKDGKITEATVYSADILQENGFWGNM
jgi:ketosteroid isomerase-like protein